MKPSAKDITRTIKCSVGRFIAIALIVGLGSGFYAALRMVCPDMKIAADNYFDETHLMDVRIVSTLGLVEDDLEAVEQIDSVDCAALGQETDIIGEINGEEVTMRLQSFTNSASINNVTLKEGRLPESANECVISTDCINNASKNIGNTIVVKDCANTIDSTLSTREFTIVGKVESPLYIDYTSPGNTTIGAGRLEDYAYVNDDAFASAYPYNEIFLTVKGSRNVFAYDSEYQKLVDNTISQIEEIAPEREQLRHDTLQTEAQAQLNESKAEYEVKEAEVQSQLNSAQNTLNTSKEQLDSSRVQLDKTPVEMLSAHEQLSDATSQLEAGKTTLNFLKAQQAAFGATLNIAKQALDLADKNSQDYANVRNQYENLLSQKQQLDDAISEAENTVMEGEEQLAQAQAQYEAAKQQYYSGVDSYYSGVEAYTQGEQEFQTNKAQAEAQLAEAKQKLTDAQKTINELKNPEWLVMDRSKVQSANGYATDAERVDSIARLFPLIFFLVAALVALTTMTRMVEEERLNLGTYKALGYSNARIAAKFLIYAAVASSVGAIIGIVVLSEILPNIIIDAYGAMYRMPHSILAPIDAPIAAISFAAGVGITVLVTLGVVWSSLRERPASLMRPKSAKTKSKILLEKVPLIWNNLSFSRKVTVRNICRFKKRACMTIIGIAGCTGLLLTGFGLNDALNDMMNTQYDELQTYSTTVTENKSPTQSADASLVSLMSNNEYVENSANVESQIIKTTKDGSKDVSTSLIVPKNFSELGSVWKIRERGSNTALSYSENGVLICEKLKDLLGIDVGENITLCQQDDLGNASNNRITVKVEGVFENYLFNYVICSSKVYSQLFNNAQPNYSTYYAKLNTNNISKENFTELAKSTGAVSSVSYSEQTVNTYKKSISAVNMIVVVLVACAALLAFIVLYNLNNINICERRREIATLQVLGFTSREVAMYIYRETILLTLLGCVVGMFFGVVLEGFVATSAEGTYSMFGREIHALSFAIACVITCVFSGVVMFIMRHKFDQVDMVESLKSNE